MGHDRSGPLLPHEPWESNHVSALKEFSVRRRRDAQTKIQRACSTVTETGEKQRKKSPSYSSHVAGVAGFGRGVGRDADRRIHDRLLYYADTMMKFLVSRYWFLVGVFHDDRKLVLQNQQLKTRNQKLLNLWHKWENWWLRECPPHAIAILRILFGGYLLVYFGLRLPHVPMLFSETGLVIPFDLYLPEALRFLLTPPSVTTSYLIFGALLLSLTTFMIGAATRTSATITVLLYAYYMTLSFHNYSTSYNRLFLFLLFTFTFSGAGKALSFEMWRKYGSLFAWEPVSILTQRLIAVQITMTYLVVGWQKAWLPMWQGGEVLYYSFHGMWSTPLAFWIAKQPIPMLVYDFLVFLTKYIEITFPVLFWLPRYRLLGFGMAILFHILTALTIAAIWWFWAMIACYICFYAPEEVERWLRTRGFSRATAMQDR